MSSFKVPWLVMTLLGFVAIATAIAFWRGFETNRSSLIRDSQQHFPIHSSFDSPEVHRLMAAALSGKTGAAGKLITLFENCASRHYARANMERPPDKANCEAQMWFWVEVGSENGDLDAMIIRFNRYFAESDCNNALRAKYWLGRVLEEDHNEPWISMSNEVNSKVKACRWPHMTIDRQ